MLLTAFFSWWYGRGWVELARDFRPRLQRLAGTFSVGQLLRTLFAPWRRIITYPGASLEARFRAWGDNLFSRMIGFIVRLFVLLAAFIVLTAATLIMTAGLLLWPLLPPAIPLLLILGVTA